MHGNLPWFSKLWYHIGLYCNTAIDHLSKLSHCAFEWLWSCKTKYSILTQFICTTFENWSSTVSCGILQKRNCMFNMLGETINEFTEQLLQTLVGSTLASPLTKPGTNWCSRPSEWNYKINYPFWRTATQHLQQQLRNMFQIWFIK